MDLFLPLYCVVNWICSL